MIISSLSKVIRLRHARRTAILAVDVPPLLFHELHQLIYLNSLLLRACYASHFDDLSFHVTKELAEMIIECYPTICLDQIFVNTLIFVGKKKNRVFFYPIMIFTKTPSH